MQIPILSGISAGAEFRSEYPVNLIPVPKATGLSDGYLAPAHGIVANGTGLDRGGVEWRGGLYRVLGDSLYRVNSDGTKALIGAIGGTGQVSMTYGFDHIAIASAGELWLFNGAVLARVTDGDLGRVVDVVWSDGYFITTDGEFIVVTDLNDPFSVNPLKYGSSEADPDPIVAVLRLRVELYAVNRYTVEVFSNIGGSGFPFDRIVGAQIQKGAIGTHAVTVYQDGLAFVGSGRDEAPGIYIAGNGAAAKISTREIEEIIGGYTEAELSGTVVETMTETMHQFLIVRLPRHTMVYDAAASAALQSPVWFRLASSIDGAGAWGAQNLVWCYDRWNVGRNGADGIGYLDRSTGEHWGADVGWSFTTPIVYAEGRGAVFHELEIVGLPGQSSFGGSATIATQYSTDGVEWSNLRYISAGDAGQRNKRLSWRGCGMLRNWRIQRFVGTSETRVSMARLEARLEPLAF